MKKDFLLKVLIVFSIAFVIGVATGKLFFGSAAYLTGFWVAAGVSGVFALLSLWLWKDVLVDSREVGLPTFLFYCLLIAAAFLSGLGRHSASLEDYYSNHLSEYLSSGFGEPRVVEGRVNSLPAKTGNTYRLRISPDKLWLSPEREREVDVQAGDIKLKIKPRHQTGLDTGYLLGSGAYGDVLRVTGAVMPARGASNPGGFNNREYLHNRGIFGNILYAEEIEVVESSGGNWFYNLAYSLSTTMTENLEWPWGENDFRDSRVMMILGLTGFHVVLVVFGLWSLLGWWGLSKRRRLLLALLILVVFTVIWKFKPVVLYSATVAGLTLLALGFSEQDWRDSALVGIATAALLILLYNPRIVFDLTFLGPMVAFLSLALLTEPVDRLLQKLSGLRFILFWLAVAATFLLFVFAWNLMFTWYFYLPYFAFWAFLFWFVGQFGEPVVEVGSFGFPDVPVPLRVVLSMQIALQLGLIWPLCAYFYQQFPVSGLLTNFLVVPLGGLIACFALLIGLFDLIPLVGPGLVAILNYGNLLVGKLILWLARVAVVVFPQPVIRKFTLWHLFVLYAALALFVWSDRVRGFVGTSWAWLDERLAVGDSVSFQKAALSVLALVIVVVLIVSAYFYPTPERLRVTFLDVGFGEAIAVHTPAGSNLLFNAGARTRDHHSVGREMKKINAARRVVAPYFLSRGVKNLGLLALQSVQPQRSGGMAYMADKFVIDQALDPLAGESLASTGGRVTRGQFVAALSDDYYASKADETWFEKDYYENWLRWWEQLRSKGIPYLKPRKGRVVFREECPAPGGPVDLKIETLNPPAEPDFEKNAADNRSLVFRLEYGDVSLLFPGDIRAAAQRQIARLPADRVESDLLVVPANGIRKSSYNPEFLSAVSPEHVVLSASARIPLRRSKYGTVVQKFKKQLQKTRGRYIERFGESATFTTMDGAVIATTDGRDLDVSNF